MNIAIINPWFIDKDSAGGTERFAEDLAISLHELGNHVDIYMLSGNSYIKNDINYISLNLFGDNIIANEYMIRNKFGIFDNEYTYLDFAKKIESLIDVSKYDFIQLNSNMFLKAWPNYKRIFTIHSNFSEFKILGTNKEFEFMIKLMKEQSCNEKTFFVCPSQYYTQMWKETIGDKVKYIPHGINKKRLNCSMSKNSLLEKYNLSKSKIKILLPSRLEMVQKRPDLILEALNLLSNSKNNFQIIFTGIDKQYENNMKKLSDISEKYKIDSRFIMFDSISEGYKLADIICVPSSSESFGYSALESIYLKKITILSNIPTYREFSKESNAIIFGNTKEELASTINSVIRFKNIKIKDNSIFETKYSMKNFANNYMRVFYGE